MLFFLHYPPLIRNNRPRAEIRKKNIRKMIYDKEYNHHVLSCTKNASIEEENVILMFKGAKYDSGLVKEGNNSV